MKRSYLLGLAVITASILGCSSAGREKSRLRCSKGIQADTPTAPELTIMGMVSQAPELCTNEKTGEKERCYAFADFEKTGINRDSFSALLTLKPGDSVYTEQVVKLHVRQEEEQSDPNSMFQDYDVLLGRRLCLDEPGDIFCGDPAVAQIISSTTTVCVDKGWARLDGEGATAMAKRWGNGVPVGSEITMVVQIVDDNEARLYFVERADKEKIRVTCTLNEGNPGETLNEPGYYVEVKRQKKGTGDYDCVFTVKETNKVPDAQKFITEVTEIAKSAP